MILAALKWVGRVDGSRTSQEAGSEPTINLYKSNADITSRTHSISFSFALEGQTIHSRKLAKDEDKEGQARVQNRTACIKMNPEIKCLFQPLSIHITSGLWMMLWPIDFNLHCISLDPLKLIAKVGCSCISVFQCVAALLWMWMHSKFSAAKT